MQDEGATTAHTLSGASPAHHIHARTQDRRVARAASVLRAQPLSPAPRQRRGGLHGQTERLSAHAGSTQIAGSSQQSGGVTWPPVVAGTQAEVRSGEGKGGGSPARAGRCALRCGRCGGRKEPSPRCVGRGSALPGPLLWARSSAPGAPGGGGRGAPPRARPARGSAAQWRLGAERSAFAAVRQSRKSGGFGARGALAAARRSHQRRWWGRALHRHAGGQDSVTTGRGRPPDSANRALSPAKHARLCGASAVFSGETGLCEEARDDLTSDNNSFVTLPNASDWGSESG